MARGIHRRHRFLIAFVGDAGPRSRVSDRLCQIGCLGYCEFVADTKVDPRRRPKNREQTRRRLLEAAAIEFSLNGFTDTSIEQIVARAGYTRGAFYSNFESKDELFLAIMKERMDQVARDLAELAEQDDVSTILETISEQATTRPTQQREDVFVLSIEFWLYAMRNPAVRRKVARQYASTRKSMGAAIVEICRRLDISPPLDPGDLAGAVLALDAGLLLQRYIDPKGLPPDLTDQIVRLLLRGVG